MEIELTPYKKKTIKKLVWVHQLYEQVFDENGNLVAVNFMKGYTSPAGRQFKTKVEKKKLEIKFDEGVEER